MKRCPLCGNTKRENRFIGRRCIRCDHITGEAMADLQTELESVA
jgi:transposase